MLHQRGLDLEGRHIDAAHFQHVVAAARVGVVAIGVAAVFVAAFQPLAAKGVARLHAVVPVHQRRARPLDEQVADFAIGHRLAVLAAQFDFVAGHGLAGAAVADVVGSVGQKDVQHLGRAEPIDDVRTKVRLEALRDLRRKRLARRRAHAQTHLIAGRQRGIGEHARKARGRTEEHGWSLLWLRPARKDGCRRGPLGHQHDRRADAQGKRQRIAQPVGEEQLGSRKADVVFGQMKNRLAVQLRRPVRIGLRVHRALGLAGRARGIQPEAGIVAHGLGGCGQRRVMQQPFVEQRGIARQRRSLVRAGHPDQPHLVVGLGHCRFQHRQHGAIGKNRLRAAVLQHVGIVVGREQGVDRHRHHARVDCAQKANHPFAHVLHGEQHALLAVNAAGQQSTGHAARLLFELAIGQRAAIVDVGQLVCTRAVGLEQMAGEIERLVEIQRIHRLCLLDAGPRRLLAARMLNMHYVACN